MFGLVDLLVVAAVPMATAICLRFMLRSSRREGVAWPVFVAFLVAIVSMGARDRLSIYSEEYSGPAAIAHGAFDQLLTAFRPHTARDWLPAIGLGALLVGWASRSYVSRHALLGFLLFSAIPVRFLWGSIYFLERWSQVKSVAVVAGIGIIATLVHLCVAKGSDRESSRHSWLTLLSASSVSCLAVAFVLLTTGSKTYAELGAAFGCACLGAAVPWRGGNELNRQETAMWQNESALFIAMPVAFLILGCSFSSMSVWQAMVLFTAYFGLVVTSRYSLRSPKRWALTAAALIALLTTCALAGKKFKNDVESNPYNQFSAVETPVPYFLQRAS